MRTTVTTLVLLLVAALLAGCGDDEAPSSEPTESASSQGTTPDPTSTATPEEDLGPLVDRPDYTFNLPKGWVDTTEDHMITDPEDAYATQGTGSMDDNYYRLSVDVTTEMTEPLLKRLVPKMLNDLRKQNPSTFKRLPDTTWGDDKSVHAVGSGLDGHNLAQVLVFLHDGASYYVNVQSPGGQKENDELLDVIRSSWTWK